MSRTFRDNIGIIKCFLVQGPVNFFAPYYLEGEKFIKNINVDKKEISSIVKNTSNLNKKFDIGLIDDFEFLEGFIKHLLLKDILELESKNFTASISLRELYQYVADCIVGDITDMFKIVQQIAENGEVDYETIEDTQYNIYHSILSMLMSLDAIDKAELETH